jgi:uncharacterized glyoxalase superfamily protein PhnB
LLSSSLKLAVCELRGQVGSLDRIGGEGDERFNKGAGHYSLYVAVDDPDAHHARASEAGATIERELNETDYGSREYTARDPEGNLWSFGTYRPGTT